MKKRIEVILQSEFKQKSRVCGSALCKFLIMEIKIKPTGDPPGGLPVKIRKFFRIKQRLRKVFSLMIEKITVEVTVLLIMRLLISDPHIERCDKDDIRLLYCKTMNYTQET